jgi:hypothetical protein
MGYIMAVTERERKVQERTMRIIRKYGGYVYKNAQSMYTEKGRPDLTACVPTTLKKLTEIFGEDAEVGLFVGLEIKRDGHLGEVSDAQEIVGRNIKKAKGIWLAIDDTDLVEALMIKFTGEVK